MGDKGPSSILARQVDCEWRSDWKMGTNCPHIQSYGRRVLMSVAAMAINMWRMFGRPGGAAMVLGVDSQSAF